MIKVALVCLAFAWCIDMPVVAQIPEGFAPLFNGRNLKGWHISRTSHQGTVPEVSVEDGAIVVRQNPYGQGGVLLTDKAFASFELYLEVKMDSFCNSGIFLRSTESGQAYQVELDLPGGTGSLFGERLQISQSAHAENLEEVWKSGAWNSIRIRMTGDVPSLVLWINGTKMWEVEQPKNDFTLNATSGMIGLQVHWSSLFLPMEDGLNLPGSWRPGAALRFRNIGVLEIEKPQVR
jgi:hypothetical protein